MGRWMTKLALVPVGLPAVTKIASWFPGNNLHKALAPHKWAGKDHRALFKRPRWATIGTCILTERLPP